MKHLRSFKSLLESIDQESNVCDLFKIDMNTVNSLIDICTSFDADFYVRVLLPPSLGQHGVPTRVPRSYNDVYSRWVEIYDSKNWTMNGNNFVHDETLNLNSFKIDKPPLVGYDILTNWDSIKTIYERIKSEFVISVDKMFPMGVRNSRTSFRSDKFSKSETYFIDSGVPIPVNSSSDISWLPFSVQN